jgi:hypothetical protein
MPAPRGSRDAGASALSVSGKETQHSSLLRVRVVPRRLWSALTLLKGATTARCFSLLARVRSAACQLLPPTPSQRRVARAAQARRCSLSFGRRRSTQAFFFCARCLMVVVGPYPAKGRCAAETSLCFGARPLCDVPAAASNFKPAPRCSCGARAWTLAVSGDEAQHSSLLCVRAVPRSF